MSLMSDDTFKCNKITSIPFTRSDTTEMISIQDQYVLFDKYINLACIKNTKELISTLMSTKICFMG